MEAEIVGAGVVVEDDLEVCKVLSERAEVAVAVEVGDNLEVRKVERAEVGVEVVDSRILMSRDKK